MEKREKVVVVFDSGVGGLTVLSEIKKRNVKENFVYLADFKNSPYGDKNKEDIVHFVLQSFKLLNESFDFKAIIIACNTASVHTTEILKHIYKVPVFSVIDAASEHLMNTDYKYADVLATSFTAKNHAYQKSTPNIKMNEIGCSSFVPFIQSNNYDNLYLKKSLIDDELKNKANKTCDVVVLGCTHFPLLETEIKNYYGENTTIINPSILLANKIENEFVLKSEIFNVSYYVTAFNPFFLGFAEELMGKGIHSNVLFEEKPRESIGSILHSMQQKSPLL